MEKLRRELEEKMAEVTRIKANLQSSEKVTCPGRKDFCIPSPQRSDLGGIRLSLSARCRSRRAAP